MKVTVAAISSMFLIIIVSLTGAIRREDTCNFDDGLCGWVQGETNDFNWTRTSGGNNTINMGPKSGHTTGNYTEDYYMLIDDLGQKQGDRVVLQRIGFDYEGRACLSFWYHMYGLHIGTLNIKVRRNGDSPLVVWSKTGKQSTDWTNATVDLEIGSKVIIEFEAIRANGSFGNMALDDVSLIYESCFNCTFDDNFCLWTENKGWKISADKDKLGMYASMAVPQGCEKRKGHSLWAPVNAMQGPVYISFLYFLNGSDNRLKLFVSSQDNEYVIWNARSNSNWSIVSTFVNESFPNFTLVFEMYPGASCLGEAGLKNVSVGIGKCPGSNGINNTTSHHPRMSQFETTSSANFIRETDYTKIPVAAIIGSVVGSLVFVVVLAIVAVCIFRKRRQKGKKHDFIEFKTVSYKHSGTEGKVENLSDVDLPVNTGFPHSSNISHTNDSSTVNVKAAMENYSYVTTFVAKPTHGTDNTYDTTWDETRPRVDGTYDHVTTHYNDLCDKTYESDDVSCSKSDANQAYDHVTKFPEGVYDKTYVTTQGMDVQDKSYDQVTIDACQTPVHIPDNRN